MAGNEKRMNPADSAGTDGAIEGQSPAENSTNTASHATRVAKKAKQKQKSIHTVSRAPPAVASASIVPASQPVTRSFAPELASSQAAFTPNTTSEALLTQQDLARSDEPHEHQHQDGT